MSSRELIKFHHHCHFLFCHRFIIVTRRRLARLENKTEFITTNDAVCWCFLGSVFRFVVLHILSGSESILTVLLSTECCLWFEERLNSSPMNVGLKKSADIDFVICNGKYSSRLSSVTMTTILGIERTWHFASSEQDSTSLSVGQWTHRLFVAIATILAALGGTSY